MSLNGFKDYLMQIGKYPLLNAAEELELGRRIREENDMGARQELANSNLRLVVYIAKSYKNTYLSIEDLVAEGNQGLMLAVDKYDYTLGYRFSTCATPWIKQAILKAIANNGRTVRLPAHIYQQLSQMKKFVEAYTAENNDQPSNDLIAKALGVDEEKVAYLIQWKQDAISMETPLGDDDKDTIEDTLFDESNELPMDYADRMERQGLVQRIISKLPERTQIIMKMRYGLGTIDDPEDWKNEHTLEEIGTYLGITRERVRQIEKETLQNLKLEWNGRI